MPRLYGGDVTITSTLRGSNRLSTSTQSPRWKCADFPGPVGTVLYGFRRTDTRLVSAHQCKSDRGRVSGPTHRRGYEALVVSAPMPKAAGETIRSAAIVWLRRWPWLPQLLPFSST